MKQLAYILFTAGFVYYVSLSAGRIALRLLKLGLYRSEERFFGFVLGSGVLSLLVFGLAAVHLAYKGVFLAVGLALIVAGYLIPGGQGKSLPPLTRGWSIVFCTGYLIYAVLYVTNGVLPEVSPDGTFHHVGFVSQYYRAHSYLWLTISHCADWPQAIEMLFLFAWPFGKHAGAAMVHVLFLLTLPLGMLAYGRRFGMPAAAAAGALLVFMSPVVGKDGVSAYVDVAEATIVFAAFYLLQIWAAERDRRLLIPVGLLCGFAFATKYIAGTVLLYALAFVVFQLRNSRREALRGLLVVSGSAAVLMAPWVVKNIVVLGNPFSPFANQIFRNPFNHVSFERAFMAVMGSHFNGVTYHELPWELCVSGARLLGFLGPVFLLSIIAIAAITHPQGRRLLLAAAIFCGPQLLAIQTTRYLFPGVPFIALALGIVLCQWRGIAVAVLALHAVLSWPAVSALYCGSGAWRILDLPWRTALRLESEEHYLADRGLAGSYEICKLINKVVPAGETVFVLGQLPRSYLERDMIAAWEGAFGERMSDALGAATWTHMFQNDYRFPSRSLTRIRLTQRDQNGDARWGVNELRFYRAGQELIRSAQWRLTAWPNRWDVQLAFDNNPVTSWSTWEPYRPGMYLEADFGGPVEADHVVVERSHDEPGMQMRLQAWTNGRWQDIEASVRVLDIPAPPRLRRAATEVLKAQGLRWLVFDHDQDAKDFVLHQTQWGMTLAGAADDYRLYHLD